MERIGLPIVEARFSRASAIYRAIILGGWMWPVLVAGLAIQPPRAANESLWKEMATTLTGSRGWVAVLGFLLLGIFMIIVPAYHLTKIFRRAPRLILDQHGMRGPALPQQEYEWVFIRTIQMSSGQRAGMDYATWRVTLKDARVVTVRGLGILDIPAQDLFDVARNVLATGSIQSPPKRFWSRLWT